ncbi:hypothetical protein HAX54_008533 [Datura stramonium]|uniref:ATPase AAA-type core domain-containing protein n=1 Tax=Datura stramonium TaxID=4076 RepID=A0ABS8TE58_DATST|nr:hypothetical protein [Datura stramonium]
MKLKNHGSWSCFLLEDLTSSMVDCLSLAEVYYSLVHLELEAMLAKAIANEAGASFINVSMSTITSKWFGEDEKNVRALFTLAAKVSPTIIFVDEVSAFLFLLQPTDLSTMKRNQAVGAGRIMVGLPAAENREDFENSSSKER